MSKSYAKNVRIQLERVTDVIGDGGSISHVLPIHLAREDVDFIDAYSRKDTNADYAVRFVIMGDLDEIWEEDQYSYLRLRVYCENESNGAGKVFVQNYKKKNKSIQEGTYKVGKSCEIEKD